MWGTSNPWSSNPETKYHSAFNDLENNGKSLISVNAYRRLQTHERLSSDVQAQKWLDLRPFSVCYTHTSHHITCRWIPKIEFDRDRITADRRRGEVSWRLRQPSNHKCQVRSLIIWRQERRCGVLLWKHIDVVRPVHLLQLQIHCFRAVTLQRVVNYFCGIL
jgi:hypothetical protein